MTETSVIKDQLQALTPGASWNDVCGYLLRMKLAKPCGRCKGIGRYSWNPWDGDVCYGCGGTGISNTTKFTDKMVSAYAAQINGVLAEVNAERVAREEEQRRHEALVSSITSADVVYRHQWECRGYDGVAEFWVKMTITPCANHAYFTVEASTCRAYKTHTTDFRDAVRYGKVRVHYTV